MPACSIAARTLPPGAARARTSVSSSGATNGTSTTSTRRTVSPTACASPLSTPGSPTAGPGAPGLRETAEQRSRSRHDHGELLLLCAPPVRDSDEAPGRTTLAASASAAVVSAANWKALKPVTTSNVPSSQGRFSMAPCRRSASGTAARATASIPSAASMPLTIAPRPAASRRNSPLPQATSRTRVPLPIPVASATALQAGAENGAQSSAHASARAPQRGPLTSAVVGRPPIRIQRSFAKKPVSVARVDAASLMPQLREELARLVAIPSISAPGYPEETHAALGEAYERGRETVRGRGRGDPRPTRAAGHRPGVAGRDPGSCRGADGPPLQPLRRRADRRRGEVGVAAIRSNGAQRCDLRPRDSRHEVEHPHAHRGLARMGRSAACRGQGCDRGPGGGRRRRAHDVSAVQPRPLQRRCDGDRGHGQCPPRDARR